MVLMTLSQIRIAHHLLGSVGDTFAAVDNIPKTLALEISIRHPCWVSCEIHGFQVGAISFRTKIIINDELAIFHWFFTESVLLAYHFVSIGILAVTLTLLLCISEHVYHIYLYILGTEHLNLFDTARVGTRAYQIFISIRFIRADFFHTRMRWW